MVKQNEALKLATLQKSCEPLATPHGLPLSRRALLPGTGTIDAQAVKRACSAVLQKFSSKLFVRELRDHYRLSRHECRSISSDPLEQQFLPEE